MGKRNIIVPILSGEKMETMIREHGGDVIPARTSLLSQKELDLQIFSFLQIISLWDKEKEMRYIVREGYTQKQMYDDFLSHQFDNVLRQICESKFLNRIRVLENKYHLIEKAKVKIDGKTTSVYIIHNDCFFLYKGIPEDTMRTLANTSSNVIKIYAELYKRWDGQDKYPEGVYFSRAELLRAIGYSDDAKNDDIIIGALDILCALGLVECTDYIDKENRYWVKKKIGGREVPVPYIKLLGVYGDIKRPWLEREKS